MTCSHCFEHCLDLMKLHIKAPTTRRWLHASVTVRGSQMVDKVRLYVKAGTGGSGCKVKGCTGSDGGNVILECRDNTVLSKFRTRDSRRIVAGHGVDCSLRKRVLLKPGIDAKAKVPPGTLIRDERGNVLKDFNSHGDSFVVAKGGGGGSPWTSYQGQKGNRRTVILELKMISDVGMVGFPNAGKSTLLNNISNASPKVADYPFTTIRPTVGIVTDDERRTRMGVADLPGLIEGAHLNKGMGHRFLRHAERTSVILLMVDLCGFRLKEQYPSRDPFQTICLLLKELSCYQADLLTRPMLLALNKTDVADHTAVENVKHQLGNTNTEQIESLVGKDAPDIHHRLKYFCQRDFSNVIPISAKSEIGLIALKGKLSSLVREARQENELNKDDEEDIVYRQES